MNRLQKIAWYQLSVIIIWLALILLVAVLIYYKDLKGEYITFPLLLGIFVHLDRVFFPVKAGEIVLDERDEIIKRRAVVTAYTVFWIAFIFGCIVPWLVLGFNALIPVGVLPAMLFCGAVLIRLVWSVAILVQYGKGGKDTNEHQIPNKECRSKK